MHVALPWRIILKLEHSFYSIIFIEARTTSVFMSGSVTFHCDYIPGERGVKIYLGSQLHGRGTVAGAPLVGDRKELAANRSHFCGSGSKDTWALAQVLCICIYVAVQKWSKIWPFRVMSHSVCSGEMPQRPCCAEMRTKSILIYLIFLPRLALQLERSLFLVWLNNCNWTLASKTETLTRA